MKRISYVGIFVLILLLSAQPASAITGGELDGEGHPNVGLLVADIDGVPAWRCTGTLIAPRVFLTAGHCVGDGATGARVWFDDDVMDNPEYPFAGSTSYEGIPVPHPLYQWGLSDPHDVGVVILDEAVEGIVPAALPTPGLLSQLKKARLLVGGYEDGVFFTSVGYGDTLESFPPPVLGSDRIRRVSQSEFVALTKVMLHLSQKAVFDEGGSCFGDSGGPLFWTDPDGNEIVTAVTSTGDAMCVATGLNYRVDVPEILEWVLEQVAQAD